MMMTSLESCGVRDDPRFDTAANNTDHHDDVVDGAKTTETSSQISTPSAVKPFVSSPFDRQQNDDQQHPRITNQDSDCNQSQ
jgi:hypothetical protein